MPFGGHQIGPGYESEPDGIEGYLKNKTLWVQL